MKEWFSIQELLGISGLPNSDRGIMKKADREQWQKRQREGVKGKAYEYHLHSLPPETQKQLRLNAALAAMPQPPAVVTRDDPELVYRLNQATDKAREKAQQKVNACLQLQAFLDQGFNQTEALAGAAAAHNLSQGSLKNWYYKVKGYPVHLWQAVLVSGSGKSAKPGKKAHITEEAWDTFLADYLRPEKPDLRACYRRTALLAEEYGWQLASFKTFQRRLMQEVP